MLSLLAGVAERNQGLLLKAFFTSLMQAWALGVNRLKRRFNWNIWRVAHIWPRITSRFRPVYCIAQHLADLLLVIDRVRFMAWTEIKDWG